MQPNNVIIKFEQVAEQNQGPVTRLIGFVKAKYMLSLLTRPISMQIRVQRRLDQLLKILWRASRTSPEIFRSRQRAS